MVPEIRRYRLRHRARPIDVLVAGEGPPLVLLHGWGLSGHAYDRAMLALADQGYRVAAPNVAVADGWSIERVAETTVEAMAGVDVAPAPIIGHSFGGVVAAHVATEHLDFASALIAVSSPLVSLGSVRLGRIMLPGNHYRIVGHRTAATALLRAATSPQGFPSLLRSARWFLGNGQDTPLKQIADSDLPRAVVWAEFDSLLPPTIGERVAQALRCELQLVTAGNGWPGRKPPDHDWPFREPAHFADTMVEVLRKLEI